MAAATLKAKKKKKLLIWGIVLIVAAAVVLSTFGKGNPNVLAVRTIELTRQTLSDTISATGAVESSNDYKVYSTLGSLISQVNVKVGDRVEAGQVLALLDTETLELNIAQSEATINQAKNTAAQQIKQAEKNLNDAKRTLEEGLNSSVISAEGGVDSAQIAQQNAALGLKNAEDNQEATQDLIASYRDAYNDARSDYNDALDTYKDAKKRLDEAQKEIKSDEYVTLVKMLTMTQEEYKKKLKEVDELFKKMEEAKNEADKAEAEAQEISSLAEKNLKAAETPEEGQEPQEIDEALQKESEKAQLRAVEAKTEYDDLQEQYTAAAAEANMLYQELKSLENQKNDMESQFQITQISQAYAAAAQAKDAAESAMLSAKTRLESARSQSDSADTAFDQAELAKRNADASYEASLKQQQATLHGINQQIESYEDALASTRIQADTTAQEISLKLLYKQLEDSTITAPISGVVTAVNAEEGAPASGMMFVIENIDQLEITTSIKEYDVTSVKEGMPVTIRTDAIEGEEFEGILKEIAPTGTKGASGGAVTFSAKVSIPKPGALRVGMNTRMDIILEEKENVFRVPFDAVHAAEDGSFYIISLIPNESQEKGALPFVTKNIPVTTGLETDFYVEIISDQLTEGMQIIPSGDEYAEGTPVQVM